MTISQQNHVTIKLRWHQHQNQHDTNRTKYLLLLLLVVTLSPTVAFLPFHSNASFMQSRRTTVSSTSSNGDVPHHLIDLQTFLKLTKVVSTGGDAKRRIQGGECHVNGEKEERRSKKLFVGDVVEVDGVVWDVTKEVSMRGYVLKIALPKEQQPGYTAPTKAKEYSGEFRTDEWRAERKAKKYARKNEKNGRGHGN